jgi:hypothetical protein
MPQPTEFRFAGVDLTFLERQSCRVDYINVLGEPIMQFPGSKLERFEHHRFVPARIQDRLEIGIGGQFLPLGLGSFGALRHERNDKPRDPKPETC